MITPVDKQIWDDNKVAELELNNNEIEVCKLELDKLWLLLGNSSPYIRENKKNFYSRLDDDNNDML